MLIHDKDSMQQKTKTKDLNATKRKTEIKSVLLSTIEYDSIRKKAKYVINYP